jgi:hypothetical protein
MFYSTPLEPPPGRTYIYTPPGTPPRRFSTYSSPPFGDESAYQEPVSHYGTPLAVPDEPQGFHPELGSQYQFQYSQCTGKRKVPLLNRV